MDTLIEVSIKRGYLQFGQKRKVGSGAEIANERPFEIGQAPGSDHDRNGDGDGVGVAPLRPPG